jgi:hypothetical protein
MRNGSRKSLVSVIAGSYIQQEEKQFRNFCWYRKLLGQWSCSASQDISHCLGSRKFACTETDHQSPSSASSFLLIYLQLISHIFCNIFSLSTRFHLSDFVITRRCHKEMWIVGCTCPTHDILSDLHFWKYQLKNSHVKLMIMHFSLFPFLCLFIVLVSVFYIIVHSFFLVRQML